jgi:hypothetical protein
MTDTRTPGQMAYDVARRWYDVAGSLIAEVAACGCETVPLEQYALCARCECLASLARALRARAKEETP